jgi:hypothetical protein
VLDLAGHGAASGGAGRGDEAGALTCARVVGFWRGVVGRRFWSIGAPCRWDGRWSGVVLPVGGAHRWGSFVECGPASSCVRGPGGCQVQVVRSGGHFLFSVPPGTEFSKWHPPSATRPSQGDAGPHPTDEPHRRPPPTAQDNARRPRPPPAGGANAPTAAQARKSRSKPRRSAPQRGAGNCATSHDAPAHRHRRKGADEPAAAPQPHPVTP